MTSFGGQSIVDSRNKSTYNVDQAGAFLQRSDATEERDEQHDNTNHYDEDGWWEELAVEEEGDVMVDGVDRRTDRDDERRR